MKKLLIILSIIIAILILGGFGYWYFFTGPSSSTSTTGTTGSSIHIGGFYPFGRPSTYVPPTTNTNTGPTTNTNPPIVGKIPMLRLLSSMPVGGYAASSTASTTVIRWVERGRGNVLEARGDSLEIKTISNTVVPKIVSTVWNKNLTAFFAATFSGDNDMLKNMYAEITMRPLPKIVANTTSTSTASTTNTLANTTNSNRSSEQLTPYELRGKDLPDGVIGMALSPKKDRVFMLINEKGTGVGYISTFDGKTTQIFTTPLTQLNVDWPEEKTIAITTKGSANHSGYLYFVDTTSGIWKKILGPLPGLSTKVSTDAKNVLVSYAGNETIITTLYSVTQSKGATTLISTLADKCVWGNFYKDLVYCGVPSQLEKAVYPDDWYLGTHSTVDKIWQVNATTGQTKLISSIIDSSDRIIDTFNLGLDAKDNYLFFMNKNDLTLWSLDLVSSN
jgi:hypothetical protein